MQKFAQHLTTQPLDEQHTLPTPEKTKPLPVSRGFARISSLTMTYFHTGIRTIIGAESFHCPVRDGKEWDQLAMVIRLELLPRLRLGRGLEDS